MPDARSFARVLSREFSKSTFIKLVACLVAPWFVPQTGIAAVGEARDFTIHQGWQSARALGMGNAFIALADDYNAILYNPAGLARLKEAQMNYGIGASFDTKFMKLKSDIEAASGSNDLSDMMTLLEDNYGNHYSLRAPTISGFWARPGWGIGVVLTDPSIDLEVHQAASPMLNMIATQDLTIAYARGWDVKWGEDHVSVGATVKGIYRAYFNRSFIAADLAFDSQLIRPSDAMEGLTVDGDLGLIWSGWDEPTSVWRFTRPTVGFTIRNVADYGFKANMHLVNKESGEAPRLGRRFDLGTLWQLPDWWIWKTRAMIDMRDMGHPNFTTKKGLHMGLEFLWKIKSWWQGGWRMGLNQGYFTAGFTGKIGVFNLDLATYAEETGPSDSPNASRRWVFKTSLDW